MNMDFSLRALAARPSSYRCNNSCCTAEFNAAVEVIQVVSHREHVIMQISSGLSNRPRSVNFDRLVWSRSLQKALVDAFWD